LSESDAGAWSARGWVLFFALVLRTPHHGVVAWMRRKGLPAGAAPVVAAAWTVLLAGSQILRTDSGADIPAAARWLDERGRGVALAMLAGVAVLGLGLLGWWIVHRDAPGAGEAADLERRARQACADGNHGRAAALYGQAAQRGPDGYARYRQAGEWMHLEQFADAEAAYRALLARNPDIPNARLNLALAVLQQGRREEARELYRAFAEAPEAAAFPELAERARLAAELVARQLALDREESSAATQNPEP
jgi:tetratricopeptide (TPR) repeat protein